MKWNSFDLMGANFFELLKKAMQVDEQNPAIAEAKVLLRSYIDSPCYVTVKLDGTNVGIDNKGLVVGRNTTIKEGQSY